MPSKKRTTDHPVMSDTRTLPLREAISKQAEKLWKRYGCPQGRDDEIWLEAERQVLGADAKANEQPGGAIASAPLADVIYPKIQPEEPGKSDEENHDGRMGAPGADTGLPK